MTFKMDTKISAAALLLLAGGSARCSDSVVASCFPAAVQDVSLSPSIVVRQTGMRFTGDDTQLVLDYHVMASDSFGWSQASESPFGWQVLEVGQGRLVTPIDGSKGALLDVTDPGNAVHLESSLAIDVSATPTVMLELTGQSVDDGEIGNDNTQEFFFKTGPPGGFLEFLMYDMGGSSVNPSGPDRGCGTDEDTPYNRDQISTRSRLQDTQCWDGFLGAPIEWRDPATNPVRHEPARNRRVGGPSRTG